MIAVLTGTYRVSRRNVQQLLSDMFGVTMSLGAISKLEGQVSENLAEAHEEALNHVRGSAAVHADETSWRESATNYWLWVATGGDATAFLIRDNRSGEVAKELLGEEMEGTLITDRWSGYGWVDLKQRQLCWAHIIRDFRKIAESGNKSREIGEELELWAKALFTYWHQLRDGTLNRSRWRDEAGRIRKAIRRLLKQGSECGEWRAPSICRGILKLEPALWTFVTTEGIEPTNNEAERAVRPAVIWRKTSLGTQSERGSRFAERMLTCVATLRQRGRNVLDFVHSACQAALLGDPAPPLLP
jgi:transposase